MEQYRAPRPCGLGAAGRYPARRLRLLPLRGRRATFEHSFNFLDSVLQGRIGDFYRIAIEHTSTGHPAVYDIPLYLLFGLWNLPTYIIYRITGFQYLLSTPAQLWLKTMMVLPRFSRQGAGGYRA